jgi:hypothetical protein
MLSKPGSNLKSLRPAADKGKTKFGRVNINRQVVDRVYYYLIGRYGNQSKRESVSNDRCHPW